MVVNYIAALQSLCCLYTVYNIAYYIVFVIGAIQFSKATAINKTWHMLHVLSNAAYILLHLSTMVLKTIVADVSMRYVDLRPLMAMPGDGDGVSLIHS